MTRREEVVITAKGSPLSPRTFAEFWRYREVLHAFAVRAVRVKYKQAAIGIGWAVLQPLLAAALFAVVLGRLANVSSEGAPYLLFALLGMVPWTYFSTAVAQALDSAVSEQVLLRKTYFPREILPVAYVLAALVDLASGLVVVLLATIIEGRAPAIEWLWLPVPIVMLPVGALAFGLGPAALNVYYRDLRYAIPFVLQLGLFASPVVWSLSRLAEPWRDAMIIVNPVACAIDGLRRIMLHHQTPHLGLTAASLAFCVIVGGVGLGIFKRLERGFADRV